MEFYISRYAEKQRQQRGIPLEILEAVLQNPQQIVENKGKKIYQSQVEFEDGIICLVRAVVSDLTRPAIVITVYQTRQISRY